MCSGPSYLTVFQKSLGTVSKINAFLVFTLTSWNRRTFMVHFIFGKRKNVGPLEWRGWDGTTGVFFIGRKFTDLWRSACTARCRGEKITFSFAIFRAFLQKPFLRSPSNALTRHYRRPDWMFVRGVNARSFAIFREFSPKPHCFCTSMILERRGRLQTTSDSPRNRSNRPLTDSEEHCQKQFRSFRTFPSHFYRVSNKSRYAHGFR